MIKKLIVFLIFCFLTGGLFAANPETTKESIEVLSERLDKPEPLLKKIEWRSFQVKLYSVTDTLARMLEEDKDQFWNAAPWRKQVAALQEQVSRADKILQQRLENYLSLQQAFVRENTPVQLDHALETEQEEVRQAIETTNTRLTQLRVVQQRLATIDASLANYQQRKRSETISKVDEYSLFKTKTYQQATVDFKAYFTEIQDSRILQGGNFSTTPLLGIWCGVWLIIIFFQYRFNQINTRTLPVKAPSYSYSRVLVALFVFCFQAVVCLVLVAVIAFFFFNTMVSDVSVPEDSGMVKLEYLFSKKTEYWPGFTLSFFLALFLNILIALAVRTFSSATTRFHTMDRLTRRSVNWLSMLSLLYLMAQNISFVSEPAFVINGNSLVLGSAAQYLVNVSVTLISTVLLFLIVQRQCWQLSEDGSNRNTPLIIINHFLLPVKILAIASLCLTLAGRSGLAVYLIDTTLLIITTVFLFMVFQAAIKDFIYKLGHKKALLSSMEVQLNENNLQNVLRLVYFAVISASGFYVLIKLAVLLGIPQADINANLSKLWNGFSVGNINISLYNIISAFAVLTGLIFLNGFVKRLLRNFLQSTQRISQSTKASIITSVGYIGMIVAIAASIAVLGVNLTSIALIASGLTLGIGFGLQTIVSNFVSGVILLLERPVSIGDWVIVDGNEGIVSDVRFRATEVKTFDKASVLVPNSSFISNVVTNMTHQERILRITIAVGVAYDSDTDLVRDVLLNCVKDASGILSEPEPSVFFMNFGESSLDFELRCFTGDALNSVRLASDLRFRINRAFKENGIDIPFPKRVLQFESTEQITGQIETVIPDKP